MEDTNNTGRCPTTIRIDPQLRRKLEDAAKSSFRSINSEMTYRLSQSFERQTDEAHP
jgi:hypothetical protein